MIVLTGGAGFIGSNILGRLNEMGEENILVVDNLKSADKYRNLVGKKFIDYLPKAEFRELLLEGAFDNVTAIFHQGACTDTMEYNGEYMMDNNYEYSKDLLHFALENKIPMVYASSAATYGHSEIAVENAESEAPLNIYGYSKLIFDEYVRRVAFGAESTVVGLRYFNVYGPGEWHKGRMASMVYQLYSQVKSTGVAKLFGSIGKYADGDQRRDFIYVKDLVDLNLYFWQRDPVQAVVNAGTGESRSFNDLANAVIKAVGNGHIEYIPFPPQLVEKYQFNTKADLTQLRSLGYDKPFYRLEDGVAEYLGGIDEMTRKFRAETN